MARITVEDCIDKLALREIAEQALSPGDVREGFIVDAMQQRVEMDEPEASVAPMQSVANPMTPEPSAEAELPLTPWREAQIV